MPIFKVSGEKLTQLDKIELDKEKKLQNMLEANLTETLDMHFIASEYPTTIGGRIDTIAVDTNGSPVIIEYKRNKNDNVINQSLSYLKWLKTQKPEFFEKLMIDKLGQEVSNKINLDWSNPRVICIAETFNKYDIDTVEIVPLRIELYKYRYYESDIFSLEPVNVHENVIIEKSKQIISKKDGEISTSIENLKQKGTKEIQEIFEALEERIIEIDEGIVEKATSLYVAFRVSKNFAEVHIGKKQIKIHMRPIQYHDPKGMVEQISEGYNWTLDRRITLTKMEELDDVMALIEQSYKNVI